MIALIPCCGAKLTKPTEAKNLYCSPVFRATRALVLKWGLPWYILSAHLGLVHPETLVEPYDDDSFAKDGTSPKDARRRRQWAINVRDQILVTFQPQEIVCFAGVNYVQFLKPLLEKELYTVYLPFKHFGIGQQLQWLNKELHK